MEKPGLGERLRYGFDNWMSKGPAALMLLLAGITFLFAIVLGTITWAVVHATGDEENFEREDGMGPVDFMWRSLMRTLAAEEGDVGWLFRLLMLVVTVGGLLIGATLIGIISGAFSERVDELRKGRSRVLESDHTLVLGWSSKVFPIVREIATANISRGRSAIVILADRDKVEMEDDIKAQVGDTGKTRVIVRSGDPMNLAELEIVNPHGARSIIVLAPEDDDDPDATVIKSTLALTNNPQRPERPYHIVGELRDPANLEAARLVGRGEGHWVLGSEVISRITVQTCRQSGLSAVYSELLDFEGCEIYISEQPSLTGRTYFDAQLAFARCAVMGLVHDGAVRLNPPADTVLAEGDRLVLIAEDDDAIELSEPGAPRGELVSTSKLSRSRPVSTLVLGFSSNLPLMLAELDQYATPRSRVTVVADIEEPHLPALHNLDVTFERGDPTNRAVLESLHAHRVDHVIVLSAKETLSPQRADARTLITLLHLRDIADQKGAALNVVSEMLDDRNRQLAEVTGADDFIVSDKLISLLMSQVSENPLLTHVFDELFSARGAEIYLRPVENYLVSGAEADFYTVLEAARRRGETAIGYRVAALARDPESAYGVRLNPTKTESVAFAPGDKIVVLADD